MKKKFLLSLIVITLSILAFGAISVFAATEGIYTYSVSNGKAIITYCDTSASGEIAIPDTLGGYPVTAIGYEAFYNCTEITSIIIPNSVISIGDWSFSNCIRLISVTIPDGVTYIGDYAFAGCTGLLSIIIPDSVISIGSSTFSNCTGLTSITLPKNLTSISNRTFYYCTGLTSIVIPEGVTTIGAYAFYWCSELTSIVISEGVTAIGAYAFDNCSGLTNLTIPKSITSIASRAFDGCKLEQVNITDIAAWCNIKFENCESNPLVNAKKIYLNGKLVNNIIIPDGVTSIGNYAFSECSGLISVTIPDSVTSIGHDAFYYCKELTYITIGSGVELLLEKSFYSCSNLKYVCLSKNIKSIRNDAFNYCSNIEAVFYEGNESQWNEILFYNRNENLTNAKIIYNATKKTYNFETNCNAILPEITNYAIFDEPVVNNEGKTFIGWYDNATFSGEPVVFPYYGNVTTLYAAWTDRTGKSFDDALTAKENREYIITTNESGQIIYYEFVPKYTGKYRFYSTGIYDTYGYLYNSNREQINYIDDGGEGNNFYIEQELTAGETYYIGAKLYSGSGTFNLVIETDCIPGTKTICVTAADGNKIFMTIPSYLPENAQVILVCYNDGKFTEMSSSPNKNETIYFIAYEEFNSAKIMVWESFENMKPLCEVEVVQ